MKNTGWLVLRYVLAMPIGIALGIGLQYLSFGINWLIDHSIALLPLGGVQFLLAIPFRLAFAGGASTGGAWWGIIASAIVGPRFKLGMALFSGLFLLWWFVGAFVLIFEGATSEIDVFSLISSYVLPILGVVVTLIMCFMPALKEYIHGYIYALDSNEEST